MSKRRAPQKLISFSDSPSDLEQIRKDMKDGWAIVSLVQNNGVYVGIMEKVSHVVVNDDEGPTLFIPPRKKIKIYSQ